MGALPKTKMTVVDFLDWWHRKNGDDRFELVDGQVIAMGRDRIRHNRAKMRAVSILSAAIEKFDVDCEAFIDGVGVSGDEFNFRLPDAVVHCGEIEDEESSILSNPVVIVEVVSPSSEDRDIHVKLTEYFSIPSVCHYLIVYVERGRVVHHSRKDKNARIDTWFGSKGVRELFPPGITIDIEELLGEVDR